MSTAANTHRSAQKPSQPCIEGKPGHPQHGDRARQQCYERRQSIVNSENTKETVTQPTYERCS